MSTSQVQSPPLTRALRWLRTRFPFGLLVSGKPHHFRDMARAAWQNRDNLGYAWRVLNHGVCDGCSLGPYGLKDNVISGTHLCMTRLNLLRLNTMPALPPTALLGRRPAAGACPTKNCTTSAASRIPCCSARATAASPASPGSRRWP